MPLVSIVELALFIVLLGIVYLIMAAVDDFKDGEDGSGK